MVPTSSSTVTVSPWLGSHLGLLRLRLLVRGLSTNRGVGRFHEFLCKDGEERIRGDSGTGDAIVHPAAPKQWVTSAWLTRRRMSRY